MSSISRIMRSAASGYNIRIGEWKGVVPHCANTTSLRPSAGDAMQVYHLPADAAAAWPATDDGATTAPPAAKKGWLHMGL